METRRRLDALLASWVGRPDSRGSGQHAAGAELLRVIVQLLNIQEPPGRLWLCDQPTARVGTSRGLSSGPSLFFEQLGST